MRALAVIEHNNRQIAKASLHVLGAAKISSMPIDAIVLGQDCSAVAQSLQKAEGMQKIFVLDHQSQAHFIAENAVPAIAAIAKNYSHILLPATSFGKNILGRLGAALDVQPISDVIKIHGVDTFDRPIYAGNAIATVQSKDAIKIMTLRPTNFPSLKLDGGNAEIISLAAVESAARAARFVRLEASESARPDLGASRVVISGGRGLGSKENFKLLEKIADQLGAAIGASRAAVDEGFVPNDLQVGQTGKIVAPELYIAVGISGAIQHIAGMKDSKVIVAINKDPEAAIFQIADYGLVGDLFQILPELEAALAKAKN